MPQGAARLWRRREGAAAAGRMTLVRRLLGPPAGRVEARVPIGAHHLQNLTLQAGAQV